MEYASPLREGIFLRRLNRFVAEVGLAGGRTALAHVPNSGAMRGCSAPGSRCRVSAATGAARKLAWTLEQVRSGSVWVGVHTLRANRLAEEALCSGLVRLEGLGAEWTLRREVGLGQGTRLDLCLDDGGGRYLVEVKNITWVEEGTALFPDAVTARGARHLGVLETFALSGGRAAVLYVAQRGDAQRVTSAWQVDPTYAAAFSRACRAGVRACGVRVEVTAAELRPAAAIPVEG